MLQTPSDATGSPRSTEPATDSAADSTESAAAVDWAVVQSLLGQHLAGADLTAALLDIQNQGESRVRVARARAVIS